MTALFFSVVGMIYDRAHTRNMDELSGMNKVMSWGAVAFVIGGLVSMGMPGLSGFIAEFPIFVGLWEGNGLNVTGVFDLNPANYYRWVAIIAAPAIVITAAYIIRAVGTVFFGEYDADKWHDMRPILPIDKLVMVMFVAILIIIGVYPQIISPMVESGVSPVVARLNEAQQAMTILDTVQVGAANLLQWLGGA
jgi:NADH-quinone oxidoreductase subunit M